MSDEVYVGGVKMTAREYRRLQRECKPGASARRRLRARWPHCSAALAVHPDQVAEANERNRRHGVGEVQYRPDGRAIIPSEAAKKKLLRLERMHDRDAWN